MRTIFYHSVSAISLTAVALPMNSYASETVTYTYDALGRLVEVDHTGNPTNATSEYQYDQTGNRTLVATSGAPSPPAPTPSPSSGLKVIFNGQFVLQQK